MVEFVQLLQELPFRYRRLQNVSVNDRYFCLKLEQTELSAWHFNSCSVLTHIIPVTLLYVRFMYYSPVFTRRVSNTVFKTLNI